MGSHGPGAEGRFGQKHVAAMVGRRTAFIGRTRNRVADTLIITILCWTLDRLLEVVADAIAVEPSITNPARTQLIAVRSLLELDLLAQATGERPDHVEVTGPGPGGVPVECGGASYGRTPTA